jgi:predicted nucleic acid-binding protein
MTVELPIFLDTNILVYAYDSSEGSKHLRAHQILQECFEGKRNAVISNQVLAEFGRIVLFKIENPLTIEKVQEIVDSIMRLPSFIKINYSCATFSESIHSFKHRSKYWDALIVQTMKENGIKQIYTENTSDFDAIEGIKAINPFS